MFVLYTDGACCVHTTRCGGAAAIKYGPDGNRDEIKFHECKTTSQRMELIGAIIGLNAIPLNAEVEVKTDSQYLVQGMAGNWRLKSNLDLWEILRGLAANRKVTFTWIPRNSERSHAAADKLANETSRMCPLDRPGGV